MLNVVFPRSFQSRRGEVGVLIVGSQALGRTRAKARGGSGLGRGGAGGTSSSSSSSVTATTGWCLVMSCAVIDVVLVNGSDDAEGDAVVDSGPS